MEQCLPSGILVGSISTGIYGADIVMNNKGLLVFRSYEYTLETNLLGVESIFGLELDDIRGSKRSTMDRVFASRETPFTDHSSHLKKCQLQVLEDVC